MKQKMFTVYDSKAETYLTPFILKAKGEALRGFIDIANDKKSSIGQHPEDYTLFEIAEWDELTGIVEIYPTKVSCGVAIEFVKPENKLEIVK